MIEELWTVGNSTFLRRNPSDRNSELLVFELGRRALEEIFHEDDFLMGILMIG
jgi:hypothetical protein